MGKRGIVPVLAMLLVIEIGVAFAIVMAQPNGFGSIFNFGFGPEKQQPQPTQTFELNGVAASLLINNGAGRVTIVGDAKATALSINATKISRSNSSEAFNRLKYQVGRVGDRISIEAGESEFSDGFKFNAKIDLTITAPRNTVVSTKVGSGEIRVSGLENREQAYNFETGSGSMFLTSLQTKTLLAKTGSGEIRLDTIEGAVEATTGSGGIILNEVKGATARLKSGSGRIIVDRVTTALNAETNSGSIKVTNADIQDLRLKTGSGSVYFMGQANINANSEVGSGSGSIELNFSSLGSNLPRFEVSTGSGDINFKVAGLEIEQKDKHHLITANNGPLLHIKNGSGSVKITG